MGFPVHPGALTATWLTDCLRASGAVDQAAVVSFRCVPVDPGNGMTGVLVRVSLTYNRAEPQAPATLVAKFSDPDPEFRAMVHSMGFFEREVRFYAEFAADTAVTVPRCHFAGIDREEGWSLLLLEDLAPARNGSWVLGSSLGDLRVAVAGIASAHAAWWQSPRLESARWLNMTGFLAVEQMQEVVARCWQPFLARLSVQVTPAVTQAGELAAHHLRQVCTHLFETPPFTLVHHDFDGENLFFSVVDGQPSVTVIDWQLTTRARGPLDVAWLIGSQCEPTTAASMSWTYCRCTIVYSSNTACRTTTSTSAGTTTGCRCSWPWAALPDRLASNRAGLAAGPGTRSFPATARPLMTSASQICSPPCRLSGPSCAHLPGGGQVSQSGAQPPFTDAAVGGASTDPGCDGRVAVRHLCRGQCLGEGA